MVTKVRIASIRGYDETSGKRLEDFGKVGHCAAQMEWALNSEEFASRVLAYEASAARPRFLRPGGLTNAEVLHVLRAGAATRRAGRDRVIDLHLVREDERGEGTIGFVRGGYIHTYRDYFDRHGPPWMAGHLAHEFAHLAGFSHAREEKTGRKHTVPYAVGEIVYEVCLERFGRHWPRHLEEERDFDVRETEARQRRKKQSGVLKTIFGLFS